MEASAMLIALGADHPLARERMRRGRESLPARFQSLARLTTDNPEQLIRVGRLRELVNARVEVVDQLLLAPDAYRAMCWHPWRPASRSVACWTRS
jgi:hypothetical protein